MPEEFSDRRRWIGRSIIAISIIHTIFAFVVFWMPIQQILADGLFNVVGEDPMRGAVTWFFFAGIFMAATGFAVDLIEKSGVHMSLRPLGIFLLIFTILGIIMMPVSGFWLILLPAVGMIRTS